MSDARRCHETFLAVDADSPDRDRGLGLRLCVARFLPQAHRMEFVSLYYNWTGPFTGIARPVHGCERGGSLNWNRARESIAGQCLAPRASQELPSLVERGRARHGSVATAVSRPPRALSKRCRRNSRTPESPADAHDTPPSLTISPPRSGSRSRRKPTGEGEVEGLIQIGS